MDLRGLTESDKRTLQQALSGFAADGDCPAYVNESGSYVIASLLLGNDPIKVGPRYGRALRAQWPVLLGSGSTPVSDVALESRLSILDSGN